MIFLLNFFGGHELFGGGGAYWYPCFGLLVTSPLGFKARVASLICSGWRHMCFMFPEIHLLCCTCQHPGDQQSCQADLFHISLIRHWRGSNGRPIAPQAQKWINVVKVSHGGSTARAGARVWVGARAKFYHFYHLWMQKLQINLFAGSNIFFSVPTIEWQCDIRKFLTPPKSWEQKA